MKPEIKFAEGILHVDATQTTDFDHDGKPSAKIVVGVELNAAEVVSEIAKKDMAWLETLLAQLKV